jgi:hypothetical protein
MNQVRQPTPKSPAAERAADRAGADGAQATHTLVHDAPADLVAALDAWRLRGPVPVSRRVLIDRLLADFAQAHAEGRWRMSRGQVVWRDPAPGETLRPTSQASPRQPAPERARGQRMGLDLPLPVPLGPERTFTITDPATFSLRATREETTIIARALALMTLYTGRPWIGGWLVTYAVETACALVAEGTIAHLAPAQLRTLLAPEPRTGPLRMTVVRIDRATVEHYEAHRAAVEAVVRERLEFARFVMLLLGAMVRAWDADRHSLDVHPKSGRRIDRTWHTLRRFPPPDWR